MKYILELVVLTSENNKFKTFKQNKMTTIKTTNSATPVRVKLVPVTDNRNTVTVIDNVTIVEVNKPKSHK